MVGLDIFVNVARNLAEHADADERALFTLPDYIDKQISDGALGDKTGGGFYKKSKIDGKKEVLVLNRETGAYEVSDRITPDCVKQALMSGNKYEAIVYGDARENRFAWECLKSALLYSAAKVPEIADDFRLIDKAMVWGYNWEKGPFAIWDEIGLERSAARMRAEGDIIPSWIEQKLANGDTRFYNARDEKSPYIRLGDVPAVAQNGAARLLDIGDGVACLEFTSKGNSIGVDTMDMFDEALDRLDAGEFLGLVVGNRGKNFSVGANLELIGSLAEKGNTDTIRELVGRLQSAMLRMKYAPRPVIAAPKGMTLGGGMEITLHASAVCAHAETYMGLVEAGVGLLPGAGGCKELLRRAAEGYAPEDRASMLPAVKRLWKNVAAATVSAGAFDAADIGYLRRTDTVLMNADRLLDAAKARVLSLATEGYRAPAKQGIPVLGEFGRASIQSYLSAMRDGGLVSPHDALVAGKIAYVLTGGGAPAGAVVSEEYLLELEKEAFVDLCGEEKTLRRISHMIITGKPLRN
jgi:3-hydroxyacyl-CoA dehydrogenase